MVERQSEMQQKVMELLNERGVSLNDIGELVYYLQTKYIENLTMETCLYNVEKVLQKREVQHAVLTGVQLDIFAEKGAMMEPLQNIVHRDEGLYGIDEVLAFAIVNIYGSIGFTNYGYVDKIKPGILEKLNDPSTGEVHTFLDDLVGAIAAAAASRLAHSSAGDESLDN